ncbi:MAG: exosortase A [Alphaproteobacteria bacterium]|jgi:exosortase A|nr:exosortase A [Alphaproteobacteria bacterium]
MTTAVNHDRAPALRQAGAAGWQTVLPVWLGALLAVTVVFADTAAGLVSIWINSATFGHGFLIPVISAALIWRDRARLSHLQPRPAPIALGALAGLSVLWFMARLVDVALVEQLAFVGILQAVTLAILGWRVCRAMLFPLAFLVFMVPFGEFLVPPLQVMTTDFIVWWLRLLDIPVFREGIFLHLPGGSFEVAEACAGLRFMIATIVLGVLFAYMFFRDWGRRLLFVGLSLLVPIIANGFRALMIVLIAYWTDHTVAVGVDHILFGWVFLSIVLVLLLGLGLMLRPRLPADPDPDPGSEDETADAPPRSNGGGRPAPARAALFGATMAAVLVSAIGPAFAAWRSYDAPAGPEAALRLPDRLAGWQRIPGPPDDWQPHFHGAHAADLARYTGEGGGPVDIFVAWYAHQRQGAELVNHHNRLVPVPAEGAGGDGPWSRIEARRLDLGTSSSGLRTVEAVEVRRWSGERRLVVPLYWVDGDLTQSGVTAKLLQLRAVLSGGHDAAAGVVLSIPLADNEPVDAAALGRVSEALPGLIDGLVFQFHP